MKRTIMLVIACVCASSTLAATPRPGSLETYRDWTIGCDNGNACTAASLLPEDAAFDPSIAVTIHRKADASAQPEVSVRSQDSIKGIVVVLIDGRTIATANAADDEAIFTGPQGAALAIAMARGTTMEVRRGQKLIGKPSLSGSGAALRYMDAQQGRAGTTTALIATGRLGPSAIKAPPALPVIQRAIIPAGAAPTALWREELTRALKISECTDAINENQEPEVYRLSKTQTLVMVPCGAGAYNFSYVPLIATGMAGRRVFTLARFDLKPGWTEDGSIPLLVNAGFDSKTSTISSFAKGRGLGDCGSSENYVWDGAMFRLSEASQMGECRGAWDWITTWRTIVR